MAAKAAKSLKRVSKAVGAAGGALGGLGLAALLPEEAPWYAHMLTVLGVAFIVTYWAPRNAD